MRLATCLLLGLAQVGLADEPKKKPLSALETVQTYLKLALNGKAKEAAALGEPGKAWSRAEKIRKDFGRLPVKKLKVTRLLANGTGALATTETIKGENGFLLITLSHKGKWLVRDIDLETEDSLKKELLRFRSKHPKAKEQIKPEKKGQ